VPVPPPPRVAGELFGSKLEQVRIYAELLADVGVERGLIGPAETQRLWDRHLLNSAVVAELIPLGEELTAGTGRIELADLGSGAGLPGLVLAILLPCIRVVLVEPMARRTAFLQECVGELGLGNVVVRRARAEDLAGEIQADVVTARAVASLDRLAVLASGLARPGGLVLAIKGASAGAELERAWPVLRQLGATGAEVVTAGSGLIDQPATVVRFRTKRDVAAGDRSVGNRSGRRPTLPTETRGRFGGTSGGSQKPSGLGC
jgi:16S rRNA (guanine527-N7)-methyltransferase